MDEYKTYEDAERTRQSEEKKLTLKFCPIIKGFCRDDCVCFNKGRTRQKVYSEGVNLVNRTTKAAWLYYAPFCTHVLISGEIGVNGGNYNGKKY